MATDAQITANRKNASKSTGPKTEKGKEKARLNALKHGGRAKVVSVMPVLPHEDPRLLEELIQQWIADWRPRDAIETGLVRRGAKLTWMLERGDRTEAAHLSHRVRKALRRAAPETGPTARQRKLVDDLGRKLFYDFEPKAMLRPGAPWDDDPAVFVAGLEETALGCHWLRDRWRAFLFLVDAPEGMYMPDDIYRFIRLMGKRGFEAIHDPALNAIFLAWDLYDKGATKDIWTIFRMRIPPRDPAFNRVMIWRDLVPRPPDWQTAWSQIRVVVVKHLERIERLIAGFEAIARAEASELADRAAFDPSPGLERHRRHQASLGRELTRIVDTLRRLRKLDAEPRADEPDAAELDEPLSQETSTAAEADEIQPDEEEAEVQEHKIATIEAKTHTTQKSQTKEVPSTKSNCEDDKRSHSAGTSKSFSGDWIEGGSQVVKDCPAGDDLTAILRYYMKQPASY